MRDEKTKKAFIEFLEAPENKDLRFWQAVRNFSPYNFIYGGDMLQTAQPGLEDTFYIESDTKK